MATAVALPLLMGGCSKKDEAVDAGATTSVAPINQGVTIKIKDYAFDPPDATAKVGQVVAWKNEQAGVKHTVTESVSDELRKIKSENIAEGQTYQLSFSTPGTYNYICSIHPERMKAKITVTS